MGEKRNVPHALAEDRRSQRAGGGMMVCERGGIYRVRFIRLRNSNALLALKLRHYAELLLCTQHRNAPVKVLDVKVCAPGQTDRRDGCCGAMALEVDLKCVG